jgi:hypothetical protein
LADRVLGEGQAMMAGVRGFLRSLRGAPVRRADGAEEPEPDEIRRA